MEVSDTGAGIAPDELPHIFDRFWSRGAEGKAGSGLGLAIARSIVEAHGGVIEADSEPGQGTTMRVRLPGPASTMMPEVYGPDTSGRRDRSVQVQ